VKSSTAPLSSGRKVISMLPIVREVQAAGIVSLQGIARELTRRGTGAWQAVQVQRVLDRAG
jgi:hypothetical protein